MILDFILQYHVQDCLQILSAKDNLGYFSVKIDFLKLFESYPDVGDKVLCAPVESIIECDKDLVKTQRNILEKAEYKIFISKLDYYYVKKNVHARFFGLPVCPELHRTLFPKNIDLGCFLKVTGTVVRVTQSKMLEYKRKYVCVKCKHENVMEAEFENRYVLKAPSKCGNEESKCRCSTFTQVNLVSREHCKDYQEIKIQEQINKLSIGTIPGSMWVVLENDLVDCCKPGDDVNICGTVRRRWRPSVQTKKSEVELVLQANHLEVINAQRSDVIAAAPDVKECFDEFWSRFDACPLKGRDQILAAVCPHVYGLHLVKLALLLTVVTGSNHQPEDETSCQEEKHPTRVRGQCHLLLVGDPGTGKSQLLRAGAALTPRSVHTSGTGSTRAGLTCSALREEGEWHLEAGALVLSDGGVCCIDEISQLREHDRTAIHEAMEQQTISIAKAGIVCKLNTRCAIVAACNPKGHYQTDQPLSVNVSLGTPLLSRFDLIFILLDTKNRAWDKLVSSYILFGGSNQNESKKRWTIEKLQMYIGLVGPKQAQMTKSANAILQCYYMMQRKSDNRDPSRTTVRMLDSLVRLSQAHCRLMYRTTILPMDAIMAVSLVDLSMQDCTLDDTVNALHSTIQKYPDFEYLKTAKKILTKLNLFEIWRNELLYYAKLLQVDHKTLECDIESNNYKAFAKFDEVNDDNIPLSSTLVTSSYFNIKKEENVSKCDDMDKQDTGDVINDIVNERLVATLKKHASMNKQEKNVPLPKKKRKKKEIVVNTDILKIKAKKAKPNSSTIDDRSDSDESNDETNTSKDRNEKLNKNKIKENNIRSNKSKKEIKIVTAKKNKEIGSNKFNKTKQDRKKIKTSCENDFSSDEDISDPNKLLNGVPSVNDMFMDLDIDLNISCSQNVEEHIVDSLEKELMPDKENKQLSSGKNEIVPKTEDNGLKDKHNTSARDLLKRFEFVEKRDLSKFYEEKACDTYKDTKLESTKSSGHINNSTKTIETNAISEIVVKLEATRASQSSGSNKKSVSSSQISMFESDCDIDLDI